LKKDCYWELLTRLQRNTEAGLLSMWDSILLCQDQDLHTLDWQSIEQDQKTGSVLEMGCYWERSSALKSGLKKDWYWHRNNQVGLQLMWDSILPHDQVLRIERSWNRPLEVRLL
jgi:hypothetical protein